MAAFTPSTPPEDQRVALAEAQTILTALGALKHPAVAPLGIIAAILQATSAGKKAPEPMASQAIDTARSAEMRAIVERMAAGRRKGAATWREIDRWLTGD